MVDAEARQPAVFRTLRGVRGCWQSNARVEDSLGEPAEANPPPRLCGCRRKRIISAWAPKPAGSAWLPPGRPLSVRRPGRGRKGLPEERQTGAGPDDTAGARMGKVRADQPACKCGPARAVDLRRKGSAGQECPEGRQGACPACFAPERPPSDARIGSGMLSCDAARKGRTVPFSWQRAGLPAPARQGSARGPLS